jgi:hypothetical protein
MKDVLEGMEGVVAFKGMVSLPRFKEPVDISSIPRWWVVPLERERELLLMSIAVKLWQLS